MVHIKKKKKNLKKKKKGVGLFCQWKTNITCCLALSLGVLRASLNEALGSAVELRV